MRIETKDLTGAALDYAVAKCEGRTLRRDPMAFNDGSWWIWEEITSGRGDNLIDKSVYMKVGGKYSPSTDWAQGGPIIERKRITLIPFKERQRDVILWTCGIGEYSHYIDEGLPLCWGASSNPLVAAMRCHVESELGPVVEVPQELRN